MIYIYIYIYTHTYIFPTYIHHYYYLLSDCVRITLTRTGQLETTADNCAFLKNVLCVVNGQGKEILELMYCCLLDAANKYCF